VTIVYGALWFEALRAVVDKLAEPLPKQLDSVVVTFFACYPPRAKA